MNLKSNLILPEGENIVEYLERAFDAIFKKAFKDFDSRSTDKELFGE